MAIYSFYLSILISNQCFGARVRGYTSSNKLSPNLSYIIAEHNLTKSYIPGLYPMKLMACTTC